MSAGGRTNEVSHVERFGVAIGESGGSFAVVETDAANLTLANHGPAPIAPHAHRDGSVPPPWFQVTGFATGAPTLLCQPASL